jgi:hypothetical protein
VPHEISTRGDAEPKWGISYASIGPDRFISLNAGDGEAELLTRPFWTEAGEFYANAQIAAGGSLRAEVTDLEGKALEGFALADAAPVQGDSVRHRLSWRGKGKPADAANRQIRLRVRVKKAALYALSAGKESEGKDYWRFRIPHALPMEQEKNLLGM